MSRNSSRSPSPVFVSRSLNERRDVRPLSNLLKPSSRYSQLRRSLENEQFNKKFEISKISFGSNSSAKSKNTEKLPVLRSGAAKRELERQKKENHRLMERLLDTKPVISSRTLDNQWRKNAEFMSLASKYAPEMLKSKSKQDVSKKEKKKENFKEDLRGSIYDERKSFSILQNQKGYKENFHDKNKKYNYGFGAKQKLERTIITDETKNNDRITNNSLHDIISYIEQNESEGEYEVYVKEDENGKQVPVNVVKQQPRIGILKSPERSNRAISKVSFSQEDPLVVYNRQPSKKRFTLPDTNEYMFDNQIVTPTPTYTEEVEYEIIYAPQMQGRRSRTRESGRRSRIDRDRINYLYDDRHSNENIRVIYNDDFNRKLIRLNNVPVIINVRQNRLPRNRKNRRYF